VTTMSWTWLLHDDAAQPVSLDHDVPTFASQSDAESWLGEVWRTLLDAGVTQVTLTEDGRRVYGPMSLHPSGG
jgi:hypothetical protein